MRLRSLALALALAPGLGAPLPLPAQTRGAMSYQQAWSGSFAYTSGDVVTYGGQTWISRVYPNTNNTPATGSAFWDLLPGGGTASAITNVTVTPLAAGSAATASLSGSTLNLGIAPGAPGVSPTVSVNTVTTLAVGAQATVQVDPSSTSSNIKLDFGIPPGAPGAGSTMSADQIESLIGSAYDVSGAAAGYFANLSTTNAIPYVATPNGPLGQVTPTGTPSTYCYATTGAPAPCTPAQLAAQQSQPQYNTVYYAVESTDGTDNFQALPVTTGIAGLGFVHGAWGILNCGGNGEAACPSTPTDANFTPLPTAPTAPSILALLQGLPGCSTLANTQFDIPDGKCVAPAAGTSTGTSASGLPASSFVGMFDADALSGSSITSWPDSSPTGANMTANSALTLTANASGLASGHNSVLFNGTSQYMTSTGSIPCTTTCTVYTVINATTPVIGNTLQALSQSSSGTSLIFTLNSYPQTPTFHSNGQTSTGGDFINGSDQLQAASWQVIAITYNNGANTVYENCNAEGTSTSTAPGTIGPINIIGASNTLNSQYLNASVNFIGFTAAPYSATICSALQARL